MARKIYRWAAAFVMLAVSLCLAGALTLAQLLPERYYVAQGARFTLSTALPITADSGGFDSAVTVGLASGSSYRQQLRLPGGILIKSVAVQVVERDQVLPAGLPFGIKMFTEGVMVVGLSDIESGSRRLNPAKEAGIQIGDVILKIGGERMSSNESVARAIAKGSGEPVPVLLVRDGAHHVLSLRPVLSPLDGTLKAGMWVRDSSAGIGTMTWYDPATGVFAGLGHPITDVDTGRLLPLSSGEAVAVTITGISKGKNGTPGELKGMFNSQRVLGELELNTESGVYGHASGLPLSAGPLPIALRHEVEVGEATIYSTISGQTPSPYRVRIEWVGLGEHNPTKNMILRVLDDGLLTQTGGIVQGMSGSPIIQNGRVVGAVTHVFVSDPSKGYGIFAENMQRAAAALTAQ